MNEPLHSHEHEHAEHHHHDEDEGEHAHDHADHAEHAHGQLGHGHSHTAITPLSDPALATNAGILAVKLSLAVLLLTALFQLGVSLRSGSVALLADTIHNFADALTAIPLWLAFSLSRRLRNRRYTYGYGRAEDLAGAAIVALIFFSALEVYSQSIQKMLHPVMVTNLGWVAAAAGIGFLGNELAAILRLRTGRRIHSAALVADGRHSQVDGFTSLGVLVGVLGVRLGFPLADPLIGFVIGTTILVVAWNSGRELWYRLMDATDPEVTRLVEQTAAGVPGVLAVEEIHIRWLGHWQHCELHITVEAQLPTLESHQIAETVRHALFHALASLQEISVHVDPLDNPPGSAHELTAHHTISK
jgi:cation diffusion facilitator family transporter